jgi:hypothetical protein
MLLPRGSVTKLPSWVQFVVCRLMHYVDAWFSESALHPNVFATNVTRPVLTTLWWLCSLLGAFCVTACMLTASCIRCTTVLCCSDEGLLLKNMPRCGRTPECRQHLVGRARSLNCITRDTPGSAAELHRSCKCRADCGGQADERRQC